MCYRTLYYSAFAPQMMAASAPAYGITLTMWSPAVHWADLETGTRNVLGYPIIRILGRVLP